MQSSGKILPTAAITARRSRQAILKQRAAELGLACIADGINVSDTGEHRPGLRASTEEGIVHPFIEAGITKQDIRDIARKLGLPVWQKPSAACLSSRIPYGDAITAEKLRMIEEAEAYLAGLGIGQLRVRLHGNLARIEVHKEDTGENTGAATRNYGKIQVPRLCLCHARSRRVPQRQHGRSALEPCKGWK